GRGEEEAKPRATCERTGRGRPLSCPVSVRIASARGFASSSPRARDPPPPDVSTRDAACSSPPTWYNGGNPHPPPRGPTRPHDPLQVPRLRPEVESHRPGRRQEDPLPPLQGGRAGAAGRRRVRAGDGGPAGLAGRPRRAAHARARRRP